MFGDPMRSSQSDGGMLRSSVIGFQVVKTSDTLEDYPDLLVSFAHEHE